MDKNQLLALLQPTFAQYGFNGASVARLATATGLGKASLYHHFPGGKNEIAGVLLRQAVEQLQSKVFVTPGKRSSPRERLAAVVDRFVEYCGDGQHFCLVALFAQEQAPVIDQPAIAEQFAAWRGVLAECYEADGYKPKAANRAAATLVNTLYGALLMARMTDEPKLFMQAAKRCKNQLLE
jgi:TetR/AcrR family transcriptional repressor of lmrAB and yxaGH operons